MGGAFYCVVAARSQVNNVHHNKRSRAFCWLAQTSLLVGRQLTAVIDALFIAVSVRVVFALVWGIYFLYPIKGHDATRLRLLGLLATPLLAHYMKGK